MINKLLSGRFILTVIGGLVFATLSISKQLNGEAVAGILSMIFTFYFLKDRSSK